MSKPLNRFFPLSALIVAALFPAAPALSQSADHRHHGHQHHHNDQPAGISTQDRELLTGETVYTCAMHPQVRSTDPNARCPICGMALVPVESNDDHGVADPQTLRLSPRALALAGVASEPVQRRVLVAELSLPGRIALDETRLHTLSARTPGRLDRLHLAYTGAQVAEGDIVAEIYSPELLAAQEELLQAVRLNARESRRSAREKLRLLGLTAFGLLFLAAGSVMHSMGDVIDMRRFDGYDSLREFLLGLGEREDGSRLVEDEDRRVAT
jgi:membrane fusion protein, copper/silver efflux system